MPLISWPADGKGVALFSLQNKIRIYIVVSIIIYVISLTSVFLINMYLNTMATATSPLVTTQNLFLNRIYIFLLVVSILAVIYGVVTYVLTLVNGLNRYREVARRVASLMEQDDFNLKSIEFPKEDEFGSIGRDFNALLYKLARFDDLKTQRSKGENRKFEMVAEKLDTPLLVVRIDEGDKIVKYYNKKFESVFAKKSETEYYDIKNFYLRALMRQEGDPAAAGTDGATEESAPKGVLDIFNSMSDSEAIFSFLDKEFEDAINIAMSDRKTIDIKKSFCTMRGDECYHSDHIQIVPVVDDYGNTLDVMIFFNKLKKVK